MPDEQTKSPDDNTKARSLFHSAAWILVIAGWVLYLLSMLLPAVYVDDPRSVCVLLGFYAAIFSSAVFLGYQHDPSWYAFMLGTLANLLMLASPFLFTRKSRLALWISAALMVLPALYIVAIPILFADGFGDFHAGFYVWWLSFGVVAGGLVTRAAMLPASAPPFGLPRFSLRTLILFTVAFGTFVAAISRPTIITVLMALAALAALIGSIVVDRKRLR